MRGMMALVFVLVGLNAPKVSGQWYPFEQCMGTIDAVIQDCQQNHLNEPDYQLTPITRWDEAPPLYGGGQRLTAFQGGCSFTGSSGTVQVSQFCYTIVPNGQTLPKKGPFGPLSCEVGSKIRVDEMSVGESVPLVGTPFNLIYTSERTVGRNKAYRVNFSFPGLKKSSSKNSYAPISAQYQFTYADGRQGSVFLSQGQSFDFYWDGKNSAGNFLEAPAQMSVLMYLTHSAYAFSTDITKVESVGTWNVKQMGLGGWNIDIHHLYDRFARRLYLGDGSTIPAKFIQDGSSYLVVSEDGNEVYYFNSSGKHITTNNSLTNAVKYTFNYATNGYLTSIVDAYGNTTSVLRDGLGNLTGVQSPYGQVTQLTENSDGYLSSITNPKNEQYQMTYYGTTGLLHTFQKPKGQIATMNYDGEGNLTSDTSSSGNFIELLLDVPTNALTVEDALGVKKNSYLNWTTETSSRTDYLRSGAILNSNYDPNNSSNYIENNVLNFTVNYADNPRFIGAHKLPVDISTTYMTTSVSSLTSVQRTINNSSPTPTPFNFDSIQYQTTTNSKVSNAIYTRSTGITSMSSPFGRTSSFTTDMLGKITNAKFANFQQLQYSYDARGRLQYVTQGTRQTEIIYNASGDISGVKNPLNQTTGFTYDLAGQVQSVILPDLRTISYTYDANGNIASITPAGSSAHAFTFNPFDLPEYYTPPTVPTSTPATHYVYDNAKRITQITKPDSSTMTFNYHATTGLLTSIVSSGDTTTMTIDPYSNQPSATTSQDGIALNQTYASNLFVNSATTNASSVNIGQVSYTYNNDVLPTNITLSAASGSSSVNYTYDNDNIMKTAGSLAISLDGTTGIPTKTTLNKIQTISSFDSSYGEPVSMLAKYVNGGTTINLFSQSYVRDALGRVTTKTETVGTTTNQFVYTYDTAGRLTNVTKNAAAYSNYTFSDNNNVTSGAVGGTAFTATYDAQDRILTYNTNTYTHTLNGEMKSKTVGGVTTNFTYNGFGMLKTAKVGTGPVLTYLYDGLNRRVGKKTGATVQKYWVYQDQLRIGAELNASGTITKKFIYGTKMNVPEYMVVGSTTYKIVSDHLGSVRLVVNAANGAIVQAMEYNERGEVLSDTSPGFQPFGFAGGLYDTDTKLVQFGARGYDPSIGRWLSKDPIGFGGGSNFYTYVSGDPINFIDPTGLTQQDVNNALEYVSRFIPELKNIQIGKLGVGDTASGRTNLFSSTIDLDQKYWGNLDEAGLTDLLDTIYHEGLHVKQGFSGLGRNVWDSIFNNNKSHNDITKAGIYFGINNIDEYQRRYGSCGKQ